MNEDRARYLISGQPLIRRVQRDLGLELWSADVHHTLCTTDAKVAEVLGLDHQTVLRWRLGTRLLHIDDADRHATRLGYHPVDIWPEWFERTGDLHSNRCNCEPCLQVRADRYRARYGMKRMATI